MKHTLLIALLCLPMLCRADDITLADGTTLRDACVLRHDAESATIRHSTGVQRVLYSRLPRDLQESLDLTPEAVQARRDRAKLDAEKRAAAREKKAADQRAALEASGKQPRYMSGADVMALFSAWDSLSAAAAEYLAAEWNRREALRCGLTVEAARYKEDAAALAANVAHERGAARREAYEKRIAELEARTQQMAELEKRIQMADRELLEAQAVVKRLEKENDELRSRSSGTTTVVVERPRYIPVYNPPPIIVPAPQPRPMPPATPAHHTPRPPVIRVTR